MSGGTFWVRNSRSMANPVSSDLYEEVEEKQSHLIVRQVHVGRGRTLRHDRLEQQTRVTDIVLIVEAVSLFVSGEDGILWPAQTTISVSPTYCP